MLAKPARNCWKAGKKNAGSLPASGAQFIEDALSAFIKNERLKTCF